MSAAEKIFQKAQSLPKEAQETVLRIAEDMAQKSPSNAASPLTLREAAALRGRLAAWEEDWNAPGTDSYDRP